MPRNPVVRLGLWSWPPGEPDWQVYAIGDDAKNLWDEGNHHAALRQICRARAVQLERDVREWFHDPDPVHQATIDRVVAHKGRVAFRLEVAEVLLIFRARQMGISPQEYWRENRHVFEYWLDHAVA
jgi:hypothetical protein